METRADCWPCSCHLARGASRRSTWATSKWTYSTRQGSLWLCLRIPSARYCKPALCLAVAPSFRWIRWRRVHTSKRLLHVFPTIRKQHFQGSEGPGFEPKSYFFSCNNACPILSLLKRRVVGQSYGTLLIKWHGTFVDKGGCHGTKWHTSHKYNRPSHQPSFPWRSTASSKYSCVIPNGIPVAPSIINLAPWTGCIFNIADALTMNW